MLPPIRNIDYDEIFDDQNNDGSKPDGGTGLGTGPSTGGNSSTSQNRNTGGNNNTPRGPYGDTEEPEEPPKDTIVDTFAFLIKSNEKGFSTFVNNNKVGINSLVRITREQLAREQKKITVSKEGYLSNEYYIVSMLDDGSPIIENQGLGDNKLLGLNTKAISLTKYIDDKIVDEKGIGSSTLVDLNFKLNKKPKKGGGNTPKGPYGDTEDPEELSKYKVKFVITGEGAPVSVLKNGNKNAQFFPPAGTKTYEDVDGTEYVISSSDTSLYRISGMRVIRETGGTPSVLSAEDGRTLETTITLDVNYEIQIDTERIPTPLPGLDPRITLVKDNPRKYNINSKSGVPLLIQKNKDVKAITIIVGDDVLEFDDFGRDVYEEGNGDEVVGITIPHRVFSKIGQYKVKLFPFSFDDYETQVREAGEPVTITPQEVKPKFEQKEKELPPPAKPENKTNPYKPAFTNPKRGGSGGGGGGRGINEMFIGEDTDPTNPFTNRGDFVDRPNYNRNQF